MLSHERYIITDIGLDIILPLIVLDTLYTLVELTSLIFVSSAGLISQPKKGE